MAEAVAGGRAPVSGLGARITAAPTRVSASAITGLGGPEGRGPRQTLIEALRQATSQAVPICAKMALTQLRQGSARSVQPEGAGFRTIAKRGPRALGRGARGFNGPSPTRRPSLAS